MKLINCYIENFGKLSHFKLDFSDGLNTVKEENGYGKTTLTVFIKAMFFGLDATKRQKLEYNDRKHYMPWQGGRCGGSLTFSTGAKNYRIERTFMPKAADDTFALYDARSGNPSTDFSENIGEELFAIDADGFERTVFLSEANLSGKNENKTISAKLSDLVGCDGDLSVMDEAIELLEKQRKVYYKRGGSGEIGELKEKLGETEREISDLIRLKDNYDAQKNNLSEMNVKLNALRALKKKNDEMALKRTYLKQYADMKSVLEKEIAARDARSQFFRSGIPTAEEIETARESFARARQLEASRMDRYAEGDSARADFFKVEIQESDYAEARVTLDKLCAKQAEADLIERQIASTPEIAPTSVTVEEIDSHISAIKNLKPTKNANKSLKIILPLAIVFLVSGIALGLTVSKIAYALSALSVIPLLIGVFFEKNGKAALADKKVISDARAALLSLYPSDFPDERITELLYEARLTLGERERKRSELIALKERRVAIHEEILEIERQACEFISHFKPTGRATVREAMEYIFKEKEIYSALAKSNEAAEKKLREAQQKATECKKAALDFLSRFPTVTDRPFDEISTNLAEYGALCRSVSRMENTLAEFKTAHNITEEPNNLADVEARDSAAVAAEIAELERAVAITERQCTLMNQSLDSRDELEAEKEELSERISEYEKKLDVIQKTKAYLAEAKDLLTSKYLSKTKSAFDSYVKLIGNESGSDFTMNTSFAVMREDHGALKESEAYSRGTRDLYALATRLALIDSLYEKETPFIILDDPFAYFDDEKLSGALKTLKAIAKEKQILYLTCTKART